MKKLLTIACLLALLPLTARAETRYVSDILVVTVRDQPTNSAQTLTTALTGDPLEVLEETGDYLRVKTAKGVEGYIRSQYVSKETPKSEQIRQLGERVKQLQAQNTALTARINESEASINDLSSSADELASLKKEYATLQQASSNVIQITRERDQLLQENGEMAANLEQLREENSLYLRTGVIKWFLAGAGVLFFGWVLGKFSRKKKRGYL